jgi:oligopeptide transport system permease protein
MAAAQTATLKRVGPALAIPRQRSLWSDAFERLRRNRAAMVALGVIIILCVIAIFAPLVAPYDPAALQPGGSNQPPSAAYKLGTDSVGFDELSRLIYGARISLSVGIFVQVLILGIGVPIGAIAAYAGGKVDNLLMRFTDVMYAFPDLLFVIIFMAAFGPSLKNIFLAIGLVNWVGMARLTRGQLLSLKEKEFVEAARAIGCPTWRILFRHLLPNALGPLIVAVTFGIPGAIFIEAALSFIGLGVQPPTATWGGMVNAGYSVIFSDAALVVYPAVAIAVTMMAFTFLGDGLRDALDPRATR